MLDFQGQKILILLVRITQFLITLCQAYPGFLIIYHMFPTATLQLGIGTFMGTDFEIRWFPKVNIKDLGDFTYWGFGFTTILLYGFLIHNFRLILL